MVADVTEHVAGLDQCALATIRRSGVKTPGRRADDEALGREEVLAFVVRGRRGAGAGDDARAACRGRRACATESVRAAGDGALGHAGQHAAGAELDERA